MTESWGCCFFSLGVTTQAPQTFPAECVGGGGKGKPLEQVPGVRFLKRDNERLFTQLGARLRRSDTSSCESWAQQGGGGGVGGGPRGGEMMLLKVGNLLWEMFLS